MSVVGIDFSSKSIHVCTLAGDSNHATVHVVRLDIGGGDLTTRVRRLRDRMPARAAWADAGVTLAAIERPYSHHAATLAPMMLVYGGLLQLLPPNIPLLELSPGDWRKECALPTRGDQVKPAAIRFARQAWTDAPIAVDDNTADAWCIAFAAREIDLRAAQAA